MLILLLLCLFGPFINAQKLPTVECWDCEVNGDSECSTTCKGHSCISITKIFDANLTKVTCSDEDIDGCTSNLETEELICHCQEDNCNDPTGKQSSNATVDNEPGIDYDYDVLRDDPFSQNYNYYSSPDYSANVLSTEDPSNLYEIAEESPEYIDLDSDDYAADDVVSTSTSSDNILNGRGTDNDMVFIFNEGSSSSTETPTVILANPSNSSDSLNSPDSIHVLEESVPVTKPWWEEDYDPVPAAVEEETIPSEPVPDPQVVLDDPPPDPSPTSPPTSLFANVEKTLNSMDSIANDNFRGSKDPIMRNIFSNFRERNELLRAKINELHGK